VPQFAPEVLISRHVEKLLARPDKARVDELLHLAHLAVAGKDVTYRGGEVTPESCFEYKQAVRLLYGDAVYSFAKVNFVLGGCQCRDCVNMA
jgi:hypothetical protein